MFIDLTCTILQPGMIIYYEKELPKVAPKQKGPVIWYVIPMPELKKGVVKEVKYAYVRTTKDRNIPHERIMMYGKSGANEWQCKRYPFYEPQV